MQTRVDRGCLTGIVVFFAAGVGLVVAAAVTRNGWWLAGLLLWFGPTWFILDTKPWRIDPPRREPASQSNEILPGAWGGPLPDEPPDPATGRWATPPWERDPEPTSTPTAEPPDGRWEQPPPP